MSEKEDSFIVSYGTCPPNEFVGRYNERNKVLSILNQLNDIGKFVLISGISGSGKSSLLEWISYYLQNDGEKSSRFIVLKESFSDVLGVSFKVYEKTFLSLLRLQRFGWFKKFMKDNKTKSAVSKVLQIIKSFSVLTGPLKQAIDITSDLISSFLEETEFDYSTLYESILDSLAVLSNKLEKEGRYLVIIYDDIHLAKGPDFTLLRDLIIKLPKRIAIIGAFCKNEENTKKHSELKTVISRCNHSEIELQKMSIEDVIELANKRFGITLNTTIVKKIIKSVDDPLGLVTCFNFLKDKYNSITQDNIEKAIKLALKPAESVYYSLSTKWQKRATILSILTGPFNMKIAKCLLEEKMSLVDLKLEFEQSPVFRKNNENEYNFIHASIKEFCNNNLPKDISIQLHSRAVDCYQKYSNLFSEVEMDFIIGHHAFLGERYDVAIEKNFHLSKLSRTFYDFSVTLTAIDRVITAAKKTNQKDRLLEAYIDKIEIMISIYNYSQAERLIQEAQSLLDDIHDQAIRARYYYLVGYFDLYQNKFKEAKGNFMKSKELAREMGDYKQEILAILGLAKLYSQCKLWNAAVSVLNEGLTLIQHQKDSILASRLLLALSEAEAKQSHYQEAEEYLKDSMKIAEDNNITRIKAVTLFQQGLLYEMQYLYEEANKSYIKAIEIAKQSSFIPIISQCYFQLGLIAQKTFELKKALNYYATSASLAEKIREHNLEGAILIKFSMVFSLLKNYPKAEEYLEKALVTSEIYNLSILKIEILRQKGVLYEKQQEWEKALSYYLQSKDLSYKIKFTEGKLTALYHIGRLYKKNGNYNEALKYLDEGIKLSQRAETIENLILFYLQKGLLYIDKKSYDKAKEIFVVGLNIAKQYKNRNYQVQILNNLGRVYTLINKTEHAKKVLEEGIEVAQKIKNKESEASLAFNLGMLCLKEGKVELALQYYRQAFQVAKECYNFKLMEKSLKEQGKIYQKQRKWSIALELNIQGLKIGELVKDRKIQISALYQIGWIYKKVGKKDEALEVFNKALKLAIEEQEEWSVLNIYYQIGLVYQQKGEFQKSLKSYNKALEIALKIKDKEQQVSCIFQTGRVKQEMGKLDEALKIFEKTLELAKKYNIKHYNLMSMHQIGRIKEQKGLYDEALQQAKDTFKLAKKYKDIEVQAYASLQLGTLFEQKNEVNIALSYYKESKKLFEKLKNHKKLQAIEKKICKLQKNEI